MNLKSKELFQTYFADEIRDEDEFGMNVMEDVMYLISEDNNTNCEDDTYAMQVLANPVEAKKYFRKFIDTEIIPENESQLGPDLEEFCNKGTEVLYKRFLKSAGEMIKEGIREGLEKLINKV